MRSLRDWCGKVVGQAEARDRGFILIVVISALGVLALVAASFAQITSSHVRTAASAVQSAGAEALADAGVQLAILDLVAGQLADASRRRFALDGTAQTCEADGGGVLVISVQDEAGKVDVNAADERLLRALFTALEIPASAAAADAVIDFRDADGDRRPQGAERADYQSAGRPQGPKNAPLNVVDELEQVLGLSAADVARLRPHVTVYSGQPGIAPSLASASLVALLSRQGASSLPADVSATRESATKEPATKDDAESASVLRQLPREFAGGQGGRYFAVRSEAHAGRAIFVREAIVELGTSRARPYVLHRWYRGTVRHDGPARATEGGALPRC
jgi:general secretion pathway protein K